MPRYAYQKPVSKVYSYNYGYMNNYYKPLTHYLGQSERAPSEQPGHQCLAERLKTFPMDGSTYRSRASSAPPSRRPLHDDEEMSLKPSKTHGTGTGTGKPDRFASPAPTSARRARGQDRPSHLSSPSKEVTDARQLGMPLWMKHPYRLPVEDVVVPPHESSIWPSSVPHFNLVSSYDAMVGYLGLKYPLV